MFMRYASSAPPGLAVTLALLWAMQSLLDDRPAEIRNGGRLPPVFTVGEPDPPPPEPAETPPDRIPPPPEPPKASVGTAPDATVDGPFVADRGPGIPAMPESGAYEGPGRPGYTDGPLISTLKVAPEYPLPAKIREIEGYVTVQFDVTVDGTVTNVRVLESSHAVFVRPAVQATERFRFRPRIVDGRPVPSSNVVNRFRFSLE